MKTKISHIAFVMIIIATISLLSSTVMTSFAVALPISSSKYMKTYTISTGNNTIAYKSKSAVESNKAGTIFGSDELYVYAIDGQWVYCSYPTSSGRKYAYILLNVITSGTSFENPVKATARVNTYKRSSTNETSIGYIDAKDDVYKIATNNGFVQVAYPSGSLYRLAWVKQIDYDKYVQTATSQPYNLSNGTYIIRNQGGRVVDIDDNSISTNGIQAQLWDYIANNNNQKFVFERQSDGTYKIANVMSGKTLEVRDNRTDNGAPVAQWDWASGYACKLWYIYDVGNGWFKLVNKNSDKNLDVDGNNNNNGTKLQQWDNDPNTPAQKFRFESTTPATPTTSNNIKRQQVVDKANSLVNRVPYFWGGKYNAKGENPEWGKLKKVTDAGSRTSYTTIAYGMDCSGFVQWVFKQFDCALPAGSIDQKNAMASIAQKDLLPGDIGYMTGHIGIYAGNGQWIHAYGSAVAYGPNGDKWEGGKVIRGNNPGFTYFYRVKNFF